MQEIDAIVQAVVALDGVPGPPRTRTGAEAVASVRNSVSVEFDPRLPARTAALHVLVLDTRIHWIVSTRLGRWAITIDGPASEIDGDITDLLEAIRMRLPFARIRARSLYRRVFAPVDRLLTSQGVHHVMLSLDGRLRYVPFAALFDGHRWLIEKYSFSQFRRPEDYLRETDRADWNIAAFGASTAIAGQEALPDVARELAGIVRTSDAADAGIVPGIEMLDQAFTREALAGAVTGGYRVIHIASHFILNPAEANGSFLLLGDGSRLSLQDFRRDGIFSFMHTALVTLSACQTAIASRHGTGLEIDSMATIAHDAGAPAVIASLWSVADSSTADLMLSLYSYRVTDRLPLAESLRRAQLDIISGRRSPRNDNARPRHQAGATLEEPRDNPFYWAAFILMGDPR